MARFFFLAALFLLAGCGDGASPELTAPHDLTRAEAERDNLGIAIIGLAARGGDNFSDLMLQFDSVELSWQPLDPNGPPLLVLGPSCAGAEPQTACVGERMHYFVLTAPAGIYTLDHLAVKLGRGVNVRNFRGAERRQFVLFTGSITYLGDYTFDPAASELRNYSRDDVGALLALRNYSDLRGPVMFVEPTPPGAPRAAPQPLAAKLPED